jgi:TatA/E family protein of Tat protein translocase
MIPGLPQVGGAELIILLCIILLFFGAKRVPSLARSLGGGIREFRKGASGEHEEVEQKEKRLPEKGKAGSETAPEAEAGVFTEQKKS